MVASGLQLPHGDDSDEFSDDDVDDETQPLTGRPSSSSEPPPLWDGFLDPPPANSSKSEKPEKCMHVTVKILKVVTYILTFIIVLGGGVISKGLVLLMTSQLRVNRNVTICSSQRSELDNRKDYVATLPLEVNVAWAWVLFFAYITPEVGTFLRSFRMCLFKGYVGKFFEGTQSKSARVLDVLVVSLFEVLHTLGVGLLVYVVLPDMDSIRGAMLTNCVAFVPGLIGMLSRDHNERNIFWKVLMDVFALVCQFTGFIVWPVVSTWSSTGPVPQMWIIPLALFLVSFGWWENYVDSGSSRPGLRLLGGLKQRLWRTRYFTYMFVPLLKCLVFFTVMVVVMGWRMDYDFKMLFDLNTAFKMHIINASEVRAILSETLLPEVSVDPVAPVETVQLESSGTIPVNVFLIQLFTAYLCYIFGKFACKICIQGFSFALPVNVTVPVIISLLIAACGVRIENVCAFKFIPEYLFWEYKNGDVLADFLLNDFAWVWLLWLVSQTWIVLHIWIPKSERLASTEKLFVSPMYNSLLVDQSLALNRRRDDDPEVLADELNAFGEEDEKEFFQHYETMSNSESPENININAPRKADAITKIYACATMWHENREEMMEFLKSIMRMDEDQSARRLTVKYLNIADNDYYEFETHIFFDDAFELSDKNEDEHVVNSFVKLLSEQIDEAAKYVHQEFIRVRPPKKIPTPYGGRLVWTLPGKTKIVTHLKDKDKIRHKKRWSQVMYMYYLLGFKLMDRNDISLERKEVIAENTLLLALDGDIDFTPKAVTLLVDLMKKNSNLGAACGRIHPIGAGLMVWYQMFEYAIGHWLQKATEHIIGCVLCSPGCFSLFRGSALMDNSVMRKYTTVSTQARHYVQYDQGEDRWLCTLLLQRGYRVEYSAASDAYTHCPEGFGEFYNQRRRWVPSTMANIMDLLQNYKMTVKINDNISMLYIAYQTMLMVGTILGPGTIFLMLVGAFMAAFKIGNGPAFMFNLAPILLFMIVCFSAKPANQIKLAYLLTAFYALVMCMVAVALALNIVQEGSNTPSAIFLYATAASFIITALLHPQEFWCLPTGIVYYLVVPSMYLLLQIYSLFNLNDVSWGTRDVPVKMTKEEQVAAKKAMEEAEKRRKQRGILAMLNRDGGKQDKDEGSIEFNLAGLFKVMCCIYPKPDESRHISLAIDDLKKKFENLERHLGVGPARRRSTIATRASLRSGGSGTTAEPEDDNESSLGDVSEISAVKEERDDLVNPYWLEDENLFRKGEVDYLPTKEVQFWKDLIAKYLLPLNKNEAEQEKAKRELKDLRNIAVFSFSMMNAIFVIVVFLLQMNKETIHINWPVGIKTNITYSHNNREIFITKEFLQLEPIGLVFVFFFALILVVQFTAMLFHRFGTFSHILSSTEISCGSISSNPEMTANMSNKNVLEVVRSMQKLQGINGEYQSDNSTTDKAGRRRTIANIARQQTNRQSVTTLGGAFKNRMERLVPDTGDDTEHLLQRRRDTIRALGQSSSQKRRQSFAANSRNSVSRTPSFATPVISEEA